MIVSMRCIANQFVRFCSTTLLFLFVFQLGSIDLCGYGKITKYLDTCKSFYKQHPKKSKSILGCIACIFLFKGFIWAVERKITLGDSTNTDPENLEKAICKNKRVFYFPSIGGSYDEISADFKKIDNIQIHVPRYANTTYPFSRLSPNQDIITSLSLLKECVDSDDRFDECDQKYYIRGISYGGFIGLNVIDILVGKKMSWLRRAGIDEVCCERILEKLKRGMVCIDSPVFDFRTGIYGFGLLLKSQGEETDSQEMSLQEYYEGMIMSSVLQVISLARFLAKPLYYVVLPIVTNLRFNPLTLPSLKGGINKKCFTDLRIVMGSYTNDPICGGQAMWNSFFTNSGVVQQNNELCFGDNLDSEEIAIEMEKELENNKTVYVYDSTSNLDHCSSKIDSVMESLIVRQVNL